VLVVSDTRWALMHELRGDAEPSLTELLGKLSECDLVIVEGFKREPIPKIEIWRAEVGKPLLHPDDPAIVLLTSDDPVLRRAFPSCRSATFPPWRGRSCPPPGRSERLVKCEVSPGAAGRIRRADRALWPPSTHVVSLPNPTSTPCAANS